MKRFLHIVLACLCLGAPMWAQTVLTTLSSSQLTDSSGVPVSNATITFAPVLDNGQAASYRKGGSGGQAIVRSVSATVTSGAFSLVLVDTGLTVPVNICYSATMTDNVTGKNLLGPGYSCVQPSYLATWCSQTGAGGATICNFDAYVPNLNALASTYPVSVAIGTVTTGAPGTNATVVNAGSPSNAILDITLPQGVQGPIGGPTSGVNLTPTASQTVTQPSGTSLGVNSLNNVLNAALFSGSDIGAKVNAAIAVLGCGTVLVPAGSYSFSTTIVKPRCINLAGQGATATKLNWTPTNGVAVVVADAGSATQYGTSGITDISFAGTGTGLGSTNTSIGLWIGGDPAGVVVPSTDSADGQTFLRIGISGFETGVNTGSNAYIDTFLSANVFGNWIGVSQAASSTNSGENNRFISSDVFNNTGGAFSSANAWKLLGTSIDFNNDGTATVLATHAQILNTGYECHGCHAEDWSGAVSSGNQPFRWYGGTVLLDSTAAITDAAIFSTSAANTGAAIIGTDLFSGHAVTALANVTGGSGSSIYVAGLIGNGNGMIAASLSAGSTAGFVFLDPKMQFIDGGDQTVNGNLTIKQNNAGYLDLWNNNATLTGISLQPVGGGNKAFLGNTAWNLSPFTLTVGGLTLNGWQNITALAGTGSVLPTQAYVDGKFTSGFSGTKTAGSCVFTIAAGLITGVTGC